MSYKSITTERQLRQYCRELVQSPSVAFDTEFVSEHTYRPVLCLIQVAAQDQLAVIDAVTVPDLTPFWEAVAGPGHETIVHSGRGELEFCLQSVGRLPERVFDVQVAAGLVGAEFPAGYGTLIRKLLGEKPQKHETRTDWRRRPLSQRQLEYAVDDVRYLHPLREALVGRLERFGRSGWMDEEMAAWKEALVQAVLEERWRRLAGGSALDPRSLAIVRELWQWRETEAQRRNHPVRRVLRDDLIVELARRQTADVKRIRAVRGLERGDLSRRLDDIAAHIQRALSLSEEELPQTVARQRGGELSVVGQFLFAALGSVCRQAELAPNLVGTPNDIRELIAYRTAADREHRPAPRLSRGWRAEFVGHLFDDLLAGKKSVRIADPNSEHPLAFERRS